MLGGRGRWWVGRAVAFVGAWLVCLGLPVAAEAAQLTAEVAVKDARRLTVVGNLAGGGVYTKAAARWRVHVEVGSGTRWRSVGTGSVSKAKGRRLFSVAARLPRRSPQVSLRVRAVDARGASVSNQVRFAIGFLATPTRLQPAPRLRFTPGGWHLCVLAAAGTVGCAGNNFSGELDVFYPFEPKDIPAYGPWATTTKAFLTNPDLTGVTDLSAGSRHACAIRGGGAVACWGENDAGQLGIGRGPGRSGYVVRGTTYADYPVAVALPAPATTVQSDGSSTCVVLSDHGVQCWGKITGTRSPVAISGLTNPVRLTVSDATACAVDLDRSVRCWGTRNPAVRGASLAARTAHPIGSVRDAVSASAYVSEEGRQFLCVVHAGGTATCWTDGYGSELTTVGRDRYKAGVPVEVSGLADAVDVVVDEWSICFVRAGGTVSCLGSRNRGGPVDRWSPATPGPVTGVAGATALDAGDGYVCADRTGGQVTCWGYLPKVDWTQRTGKSGTATLALP